MRYQIILGDCTERLADIASQSVDAVITDPPYPEIDRPYGRLTEQEWWDMMMIVCRETRRILKPTGSAVFILQPNSRKVGSMRGWLWEFMAWVCREWNMVQDVWWWNHAAMPAAGATEHGLTRSSVKACVWAGDAGCYRAQDVVLWGESERNAERRNSERFTGRIKHPSGHSETVAIFDAAVRRGGVTPFNLLPIPNTQSTVGAGSNGHGAGTPERLASWWTRYICPPGGVVCDPFMGSGTMGLAALAYGCRFIGIEKMNAPGYYPTAAARLAEAALQPMLEFSTTPSNITSSRPPELAGLWDSAESEPVAVTPAAADADR